MKRVLLPLDSFKFVLELKSAFVLRPTRARWPVRFILAGIKALSKLPYTVFRSTLTLDCNERVVEYPFVLQKIPVARGLRVLDFGCSESLLPIWLSTLGAEVVGVDLRDYELEHPNFEFRKGDFLRNHLPDASFDAIVAVSAVEHSGLDVYGSEVYEEGDRRVLREFERILKPGGTLLLTVPFGQWRVVRGQRIYDCQQLDELLREWLLVEREFYCKGPDGRYWQVCTEEVASQADFDRVTGTSAVALMVCRKRSE